MGVGGQEDAAAAVLAGSWEHRPGVVAEREAARRVGLGLALSRGLTEAMGGTLEPEETPGGGLTMVVSLHAAPQPAGAAPGEPGRRERDATRQGPGRRERDATRQERGRRERGAAPSPRPATAEGGRLAP